MNRRAFREEMALKGRNRKRFVRRNLLLHECLRCQQLPDRAKIIFLVGGNAKSPSRREQAMHRFKKSGLHDAPALVFPFQPGIGKKQMNDIGGTGREEILNGIAALNSHDAQVPNFKPRRLFAGSSDAAAELFDAEEISLRKICRELRDESAISATEIDLERRDSAKDKGKIERRKVVRWSELDFRVASCIRCRLDRGNLLE